MAIWGACTNILNWIFSVWEASVQRVWWLTFWHQLLSCDTAIITSGKNKWLRDVLLLHQQKKLFSSIFCQAWSFSSFLHIWRVPRRHTEGLRRHCVRDQNEGGRSAKRSLVLSWGYWDGEEPRDSPFYWSIWDLLRCLVLQSNKSNFFVFRAPVFVSCKTECYSDLDHSLSLLILIQNLTSPPEGRFKLSAFP